jgi:hypothetical protein
MSRRVYQFGLLPPTQGAALAWAQLRAARDYRNDLVAIERGRRHALRLVDDTDEVREAIEVVKQATKAGRKSAIEKLRLARKAARAAAADELSRIQELDDAIRKDAYALSPAMWGTRSDVNRAHEQARSAPLYGDDAVSPSDPRFVYLTYAERLGQRPVEGQIVVQLQGGMPTSDAYRGRDTRVRLVRASSSPNASLVAAGTLWLRVGSEDRRPVWAKFPIAQHREIPASAMWKWVRVSCRSEGQMDRWSCEITVDDAAPMARSLDADLAGTIAVEWEWSPTGDGGIRVARWADDFGQTGEVVLARYDVEGIRKPDEIRAVRDKTLNDLRPKLVRAIRDCGEQVPAWLAEAASTMHLWKSPMRFYALVDRWRRERCDAARSAYELLDAWWLRDTHLYQYESSARRQAIRRRRDRYRVLAAQWARKYRRVLLSDQDLSREARWGEESDVRFTAGVSELRACLRNSFGDEDAIDARWHDDPGGGEGHSSWCERTRDAWMAGGARGDGRFAKRKEKTLNAWAARKAKKAARLAAECAAREAACNNAE